MRRLSGAGNRKMIYIGGGIAAIVVAAIVAASLGLQMTTSPAADNTSPAENVSPATSGQDDKFTAANLVSAGAPVLGDPEAKVTIVDFSDFQCTNSRRFATQTEPQIVRDYIDPGMANIVFVHFPVFGPDSVTAASASMCADEQGKFWEFHDHLYANQGVENSGWASADNMRRFASEVGLDQESFDTCLKSDKYGQQIQSDLDLALSRGFSRTPSFIIMKGDGSDAEVLAGAQPYSTFKTLINKKLT